MDRNHLCYFDCAIFDTDLSNSILQHYHHYFPISEDIKIKGRLQSVSVTSIWANTREVPPKIVIFSSCTFCYPSREFLLHRNEQNLKKNVLDLEQDYHRSIWWKNQLGRIQSSCGGEELLLLKLISFISQKYCTILV